MDSYMSKPAPLDTWGLNVAVTKKPSDYHPSAATGPVHHTQCV